MRLKSDRRRRGHPHRLAMYQPAIVVMNQPLESMGERMAEIEQRPLARFMLVGGDDRGLGGAALAMA